MNLTELRASARRKIGIGITVTDYPDVDVDAALNEWYRTITGWIFAATGIWEFSGEVSTTDLVANQSEYVLPTKLVALNRVEIKYPNANKFVKARRIDDKETDEAFGNGTISSASEADPVFRLFDNSLFVYPAPTTGVSGGLRTEIIEDVTSLASSGDLPNLNPLIHRALAVAAAHDYALSEEMDRKANRLYGELYGRAGMSASEGLKSQIEELAVKRDMTTKARIVPRFTSFR